MSGPDYYLLLGILGIILSLTIDYNRDNILIEQYQITDFSYEIFWSGVILLIMAGLYSWSVQDKYKKFWDMVDSLKMYCDRNS